MLRMMQAHLAVEMPEMVYDDALLFHEFVVQTQQVVLVTLAMLTDMQYFQAYVAFCTKMSSLSETVIFFLCSQIH